MRTTVLTVPVADLDLATDRLWQIGARAVEERSGPAGRLELRTVLADHDDTSEALVGELPTGWTIRFEAVDRAPAETWREFAAPIRVGEHLVLRPAWLPPSHAAGVLDVSIEPGGSFGLGDHPTTRLSAAAVERLIRPSDQVLDVGCGSGVLSIVAALGGARRVTAIDIAPAAVEATRANADANGVGDLIDATSVPISSVNGSFDLVVANILAPTLVEMATELRSAVAAGGRLVVSGVLADAHGHVLSALEPMQVERTDELDGWVAVTLRHSFDESSSA